MRPAPGVQVSLSSLLGSWLLQGLTLLVRVSAGGRGFTERQHPTKTANVAVMITFSDGGTVTASGSRLQANRAACASGTGSFVELVPSACSLRAMAWCDPDWLNCHNMVLLADKSCCCLLLSSAPLLFT